MAARDVRRVVPVGTGMQGTSYACALPNLPA